MKIAITTFGGNINLEGKNIKSEDLWFLRLYYIYVNHIEDVDFIVNKPERPFEKSIDIVDFNEYDEVIIYNAPVNFFGGTISQYTYQVFNKLLTYKGKIKYFLVDPKMFYQEMGSILLKRENLKIEGLPNDYKIDKQLCIDFTNKVSPRITYIFGGRDFTKYKNLVKDNKAYYDIKNVEYCSLFEFISANQRVEFPKAGFNRKYDIVYYGNHRGTDRDKKLKMYFNGSMLKKYWIGYDPEYPFCDVDKYVNKKDLPPLLVKAYSTLVLGDETHNRNILTPRLFEVLNSDLVAFFDEDYVDDTMIKSHVLRDFCIVNCEYDLKKKIEIIKNDEVLFRDLINLQLKELETYAHFKINNIKKDTKVKQLF